MSTAPTAAPAVTCPAPGTLCEHCVFHDGRDAAPPATRTITNADGAPISMCASCSAIEELVELAVQSFDDKPYPYTYAPGEIADLVAAALAQAAALAATAATTGTR